MGRSLLALLSSVPPFATVLFDVLVERRGAFGDWRLLAGTPERAVDRPVAWLLRNPVRGALAGLVAVAVAHWASRCWSVRRPADLPGCCLVATHPRSTFPLRGSSGKRRD